MSFWEAFVTRGIYGEKVSRFCFHSCGAFRMSGPLDLHVKWVYDSWGIMRDDNGESWDRWRKIIMGIEKVKKKKNVAGGFLFFWGYWGALYCRSCVLIILLWNIVFLVDILCCIHSSFIVKSYVIQNWFKIVQTERTKQSHPNRCILKSSLTAIFLSTFSSPRYTTHCNITSSLRLTSSRLCIHTQTHFSAR